VDAIIYKGDDTSSFGNSFLTIEAEIPEGYSVSKAEIKVGNLPKMVFKDPVFPLVINLTSQQTRSLDTQNEVTMAVYDGSGKRKTCEGLLRFIAKDGIV
jgi:hypothetical protein